MSAYYYGFPYGYGFGLYGFGYTVGGWGYGVPTGGDGSYGYSINHLTGVETVTVTAYAYAWGWYGTSDFIGGFAGSTGGLNSNTSQLTQDQWNYYNTHPSATNKANAISQANSVLATLPASYSNMDDLAKTVGNALETVSINNTSEISVKIFFNPSTSQYTISNAYSDGNAVSVNEELSNGPTGNQVEMGYLHTHPLGDSVPSDSDMYYGSIDQNNYGVYQVVYTVGNDGHIDAWESSTPRNAEYSSLVQ